MILALLAACATPADPAADRAAFLRLECAQIRDAAVRDDCLVFATREHPTRAGDHCPAVANEALRDECWFIAVDAQELVGETAARACRGTGRFVRACAANAISREVSALPEMEEAALVREIDRIIAQHRHARPGEATEMARRKLGSTSR